MVIRHEIRLAGHGGQGIMLAGYIIGQAASIFEGRHATYIRDYGPAARGGASRADVVISDERVLYPSIEAPQVLIIMSPKAYDTYYTEKCQDSLLLIDKDLVKPDKTPSEKVMVIPATRIAEELGRAAVANTVMLGFFIAVTDIVSTDAMKKSLLASAPKGTGELNLKAFERGYSYGLEQLKTRKERQGMSESARLSN